MFEMDYVKGMAKALENVMKPGAFGHLVRSALRFDQWYKVLVSEKYEERDSTREDSAKGGSENQESESIELHPTFEINNHALHYNCLVWHYRQTIVAQLEAYTSVEEMAIYVWRSEASRGSSWASRTTKTTER